MRFWCQTRIFTVLRTTFYDSFLPDRLRGWPAAGQNYPIDALKCRTLRGQNLASLFFILLANVAGPGMFALTAIKPENRSWR